MTQVPGNPGCVLAHHCVLLGPDEVCTSTQVTPASRSCASTV